MEPGGPDPGPAQGGQPPEEPPEEPPAEPPEESGGAQWGPEVEAAAAAAAVPGRPGRFRKDRAAGPDGLQPAKRRTTVFRRWLLARVGEARLRGGTGAVDVAGGSGQLAFELLNVNGVPTTIVDPREVRLDKWCAYYDRSAYGRREAGARMPSHLREFFEPALWASPASSSAAASPSSGGRSYKGLRKAWAKAHDPEAARSKAEERRGAGRGARDGELASSRPKKTRFRGVFWDKKVQKYRAAFFDEAAKRSVPLGHFERLEAAAAAHDRKALEVQGAGATVNLEENLRPGGQLHRGRRHGGNEARAAGCWACGPKAPAGAPRSAPREADGFSGHLQHKNFQCPHRKKAAGPGGAPRLPVPVERAAAPRVLAAASIVLGLHPDQATDALVDYALEHSRPFAVVPCCVFKEHFPHRRLPDGRSVETYEDLVAWIGAKDPGIRTERLPMRGRNVVLYKLEY